MISLASADIPFKAYKNIFDCLKSERIGRGKYVKMLEEKAKEYFRVKHCVAVANGTLADIVMLATLKEMYPGKDEVLLPALTFVAHSNSVLWAGLKPVFVDVGDDFQMNASMAKDSIRDNTLCLFPAHLLGVKSLVPEFKINTPIIEDCCEAMGGGLFGPMFGTMGIAGSFSMYPSHTITTGEGGLIITNNDEFYNIADSIHNHGKIASDFDFKYVGINAKMTNLQAAIGCAVFDTIDDVNEKRRSNVSLYNEILGFDFYAEAPHCYPVIYKSQHERDVALKELETHGVEARKLMSCVPGLSFYKKKGLPLEVIEKCCERECFPVAERLASCGLFLPVHQKLTWEDIEYVCEILPKP